MDCKTLANLEHHGRETYAVYYGDDFVLKRPLPNMSDTEVAKWLKKQHKTKDAIDSISSIGNPVYNIPKMIYINDDEFQILEERAPGQPLTNELYQTLSPRQQFEIITSLGSFLVDMNESKPVGETIMHHISDEIKLTRLNKFIETKMPKWFTADEVSYAQKVTYSIESFVYPTRQAWSHCDLNPGNVYYDVKNSRLSFIDFAEADYNFIYRDIFSKLQVELGICKPVYETYLKLHDKSLYPMPSAKNETLREILAYRMIVIYLKRFIKASDDLRTNPQNQKSIDNNLAKIQFMRNQLAAIQNVAKQSTL